MSNWQLKLDLTDVWNKYPDEVRLCELCGIISERLRKLNPIRMADWIIEQKESIADEFEIMSIGDDATEEEFNDQMDALYDWGDTVLDRKFTPGVMQRKVCWIATQF